MQKNGRLLMASLTLLLTFALQSLFSSQILAQDISRAEEIEKYLLENFDFQNSSTSNWDQAKVIFLGDTNHSDHDQNNVRRKLINLIIKNGKEKKSPEIPLVLIEGLDSSKILTLDDYNLGASSRHILPLAAIGGWDDIDKIRESKDILKTLLKLMKDKEKIVDKIKDADNCSTRGDFYSMATKLELVSDIFAIQMQQDQLMTKSQRVMTNDRNANLKRVLNHVLKLNNGQVKVFVIAGSEHFTEKYPINEKIISFAREENIPFYFTNSKIISAKVLEEMKADPTKYARELVSNLKDLNEAHQETLQGYDQIVKSKLQHKRLLEELHQLQTR